MAQVKQLLVVDDNVLNRTILSRILMSAGYVVLESSNGEEALSVLEKNYVSLILLDLIMPVMDGYEFLKNMGERGFLSTVPVIVTTGSSESEVELSCFDLGASDFITKPYNPDLVLHRVQSILRLFDNALMINRLKYDTITGLLGSDAFYQALEDMMASGKTEGYDIVAVDVANYKALNERVGIAASRDLLHYLAKQISMRLGEDCFAGRVDSDTCAIVRPSTPVVPAVEDTTLLESLEAAPVRGVRLDFGVYHITKECASLPAATVCNRALIALREAKNRLAGHYAVYDEAMSARIRREEQLEGQMETALEERQFAIYLQPKYSVSESLIAGAESLVRWISPECGFVSPGDFIPLFERNGFITKLDLWVWEETCRLLRRWMDEGRDLIPVSVNVSRIDLLDTDLPTKLVALVERYDIPYEYLHLEVTESAYTENPDQIIAAVKQLCQIGFKIEMDDFGSGYSSLNMLSVLPLDYLKIDMMFLRQEYGIEERKRSVINFVISLSKWLGLPVIAEGVETQSELDFLKTVGCDYVQGYYYSKPLPVDGFEQFMDAEAARHTDGEAPRVGSMTIEESKENILIVDDVKVNREILAAMLGSGYNILEAGNGEEALEVLRTSNCEIEVILLDLMMPVKDGFQFLQEVSEDDVLCDVPIIVTSERTTESECRAIDLGAQSFLPKPYAPIVVKHYVKSALELYWLRRLVHGSKSHLEMSPPLQRRGLTTLRPGD